MTLDKVGSAHDNDRYRGAPGELTGDLDTPSVRLHDGFTRGGVAIMQIINRTTTNEGMAQRRLLVSNGTLLASNLDAAQEEITVRHDALANGDIVVLERGGVAEWMRVTSAAVASGNYFTYTVTRDLASAGAQDFPIGTGVVNTGQAGDLFFDLSGGETLAGHAAPTAALYQRTGTNYDDLVLFFRLGELDGDHDYVTSTLGLALGEKQTSGRFPWITFDDQEGLRIHTSEGVLARVNELGEIVLGRVDAGLVNLFLEPTGEVRVRLDETVLLDVDTDGVVSVHGTNAPLLQIETQTDKLGEFGATPVSQPASAAQEVPAEIVADGDVEALSASAPDAPATTDGAIAALTFSAAYDPAEIEALRDLTETLADDYLALRNTVASYGVILNQLIGFLESTGDDLRALRTLVLALRTALVDTGRIKGSA